MAIKILVAALLCVAFALRVEEQKIGQAIQSVTPSVPCYLYERPDQQQYGLTFEVYAASKIMCNPFMIFNNQGAWETEVLDNTFINKTDDAGLCSCSIVTSDGPQYSHKFEKGKILNQKKCTPRSCFESYSYLMYAAIDYKEGELGKWKGYLHSFDHWKVSAKLPDTVQKKTIVPAAQIIQDIEADLSPRSVQKLHKELHALAGAIVQAEEEADLDHTPQLRVDVVTDPIATPTPELQPNPAGGGCKPPCYNGKCKEDQCECDVDWFGDTCNIHRDSIWETGSVITVPVVVDARKDLVKVVALQHNQGICSRWKLDSTGLSCGPIEDAATCELARGVLEEMHAVYNRPPKFKFEDYSTKPSRLQDKYPAYCSAKIISGKRGSTWHLKFYSKGEKEESLAKASRKNSMMDYRLICGCWKEN